MPDPLPGTGQLHNWSGSIGYSTGRLHRPTSLEQLQHLVATTPRLRVLGTRHSFNRIADTTGDLVSLAGLPDEPELVDGDRVAVGGATTYGQLAGYLQERGRALHNLGSLPHISVTGACATGTHGSGLGHGCLATAAVAVEFVRGDGDLVRLQRGDTDFPGAVLALGALGPITRLELETRPSFEIRQDVWLGASLDRLLPDLDAVLGSGYSVSLFSYWDDPGVIDQIWIKALAGAEPVDGRLWGARPARTAQHPIRGADPAAATHQLRVPGPWNTRLPHFRLEFTPSHGDEQQSEFFVARADGPAAIEALCGARLSPALQVCEMRTIAADDLWLSPFRERDTLALHFTWVNDDALVQAAVEQVEAALAPFDARPHWAKVFRMPPADVRRGYPLLGEFRRLAAAWDPDRRFGNAFLETFVYD